MISGAATVGGTQQLHKALPDFSIYDIMISDIMSSGKR